MSPKMNYYYDIESHKARNVLLDISNAMRNHGMEIDNVSLEDVERMLGKFTEKKRKKVTDFISFLSLATEPKTKNRGGDARNCYIYAQENGLVFATNRLMLAWCRPENTRKAGWYDTKGNYVENPEVQDMTPENVEQRLVPRAEEAIEKLERGEGEGITIDFHNLELDIMDRGGTRETFVVRIAEDMYMTERDISRLYAMTSKRVQPDVPNTMTVTHFAIDAHEKGDQLGKVFCGKTEYGYFAAAGCIGTTCYDVEDEEE